METSNQNLKNNKIIILLCIILLSIHSSGFSQNKIGSLIASVNYTFAVPIIGVLFLAVFLLTAFIKERNH